MFEPAGDIAQWSHRGKAQSIYIKHTEFHQKELLHHKKGIVSNYLFHEVFQKLQKFSNGLSLLAKLPGVLKAVLEEAYI